MSLRVVHSLNVPLFKGLQNFRNTKYCLFAPPTRNKETHIIKIGNINMINEQLK